MEKFHEEIRVIREGM